MNENHRQLCPSPQWAEHIRTVVLPAVTDGVDLGSAMLEIGPGPGAATDWLRHRVARLVTVERDRQAAAELRARYAGSNVEVLYGDAAELSFADASFDSAGCFTMLHHVPSNERQDAILAEALRVLRPGGVLVGSDSLPSQELREFHEGDTYNPVEPGTFADRLRRVGYDSVAVRTGERLEFVAYKPAASQ
jgi:ubiquinone/menaquinone biosynthesis C-methylase UbiE